MKEIGPGLGGIPNAFVLGSANGISTQYEVEMSKAAAVPSTYFSKTKIPCVGTHFLPKKGETVECY